MPELNPRDRLQPFLLDRLTDDTPGATKESREKNVMSPQQLKVALLRDLTWLLNTPATLASDALEFPNVAASVLNYGIPDLAGVSASGLATLSLERLILKAIQTFEPRIDKRSVSVRLHEDDDEMGPNALSLEIRGDMIANQMPESLYIKTEVDLETGQFALKDRPNG